MQRNLRGFVLGSFLIGAMGFAACSSDDEGDDDTGVGGSDMGGAGGAKTGTTTAKGGAGPTGGTTATGGVGATSSTPTSSAPQGGSGPTSSAPTGGTSPTSSTVAAGAPGTGGATTGGAPSGGATATGGTTAAGGTTGVAGAAGNAGDPGVAGAAGAGPTTPGWTFDTTAESWAISNGWNDNVLDSADGVTLVPTSGALTWTVPFTLDWDGTDTAPSAQESYVGVQAGSINLDGKTLTVRIRWVSGGTGTTTGVSAVFGVYIAFNDADDTFKNGKIGEFTSWSSDKGGVYKDLTYAMPAAAEGFDPTAVKSVSVAVQTATWTDTPQPTFDYATAVFEIDSVTYQ